MKLSASLLSSDILNIEQEIHRLESLNKIDYLHIDVMDGRFVPNIAFGIDFIARISEITTIPINVHLMVEDPHNIIAIISKFRIHNIVVHAELEENYIVKTLDFIRNNNIKPGLAINPATEISSQISQKLPLIDYIIVMGVVPGFGGQTFIPQTINKIRRIKEILKGHKSLIEVDGGINNITAPSVVEAGADILVLGSYLFNNRGNDYIANMQKRIQVLCANEEV